MADLEIKELTKRFETKQGEVCAVRDVSWYMEDGEFLVLLGPSGCGKTTTLRLIAGLENPSDGTIRIGGRIVNDIAPKDRDVAMVFQSYALYPHMTVFKNMAFGLKMRRVAKSEILRKVTETATLLRIEHLLDRKPASLSSGECQRVALGRAIVRNPNVFLFDEPLSNLDTPQRLRTRTEIKRIQQTLGTTTVHVTHDQEEAMVLGDRIAVMDQGTIQQIATPADIYQRPCNRFVAAFIGAPTMNLLTGRLEQTADQLCFASDSVRIRLGNGSTTGLHAAGRREVILGVRPEHLGLGAENKKKSDAEGSSEGQYEHLANADVSGVDNLGDRAHVHLDLAGGTKMIARLSPDATAVLGRNTHIFCDPSKLHFFASDELGERIN